MFIEFCLPAYNESAIIEANALRLLNYCLKQNFAFDWRITIVVNGSDKTFEELVGKIVRQNSAYLTMAVYQEQGKGLAVKNYGQTSQADIFVYMDTDLAVSLDDIPALINPLINHQADLVFGSRMLPDSICQRSAVREWSSQFYVFLSRIILGHNFSDMQCGFKAINAALLKKIIPLIKSDDWFFDTELIYFAKQAGAKIKEIPVNWSENRYEQRRSKINIVSDGCKFIKNLLVLRLRKKSYASFLERSS